MTEITVNKKVQAELMDPVSYQAREAQMERERLLQEILEGEKDIEHGRTLSVSEVFAALRQCIQRA